jgi:hypothetical protein
MESSMINSSWYLTNYYISPLEPGDFSEIYNIEFELVANETANFKGQSYLIALYDKAMVDSYESHISGSKKDADLSTEETCSLGIRAKNQKVIKSLGTQVSNVYAFNDGYTIQYRGGDKCFYKNNM